MSRFSNGGPSFAEGCDPALPPRDHKRDVMFDVYNVSAFFLRTVDSCGVFVWWFLMAITMAVLDIVVACKAATPIDYPIFSPILTLTCVLASRPHFTFVTRDLEIEILKIIVGHH